MLNQLKYTSKAVLLGFVLVVLFLGCSKSPEEEAKKAIEDGARSTAKTFFDEVSVPKAETRDSWGMSDYRIFQLSETKAFRVEKLENTPDTYTVVIPFWCAGTSLEGDQVKRRRELSVTVERNPEKATWTVLKHEFRKDEPLSIWWQLGGTYFESIGIGFVIIAVGYYLVFYAIYWVVYTANMFSFDPYGRMVTKPDSARSKEASEAAEAVLRVLLEIAIPIIIVVVGFKYFSTRTAVLVPVLLSYAAIRFGLFLADKLIFTPYQQAKERMKPPGPVEVPDLVKEELLRQVREKIGSTEYKKLVDALGEDGLVQMIIQASKDKQ